MPILATGSQLNTDVSFNSGTLDINGFEMAALQDVTVTMGFSTKEIRALGTIKMITAPKRYGWKAGAKFKVQSLNQQMFTLFMGSSNTDGSGFGYSLVDGQNVLTRCSIKCIVNEAANQHVEFQFTNAILAGNLQAALKMESPAELDFEIQAQDVNTVSDFTG